MQLTLNNRIDSNVYILTSLSLSLELSASLGATDDVVSRSDALPLSSDVPGSFAIVSEFCKSEKETQRNIENEKYLESIKKTHSYDKMVSVMLQGKQKKCSAKHTTARKVARQAATFFNINKRHRDGVSSIKNTLSVAKRTKPTYRNQTRSSTTKWRSKQRKKRTEEDEAEKIASPTTD